MKKITFIIAAIFAMAQMNAATSEVAADNATNAEAPAVAAAGDDGERAYQHPFGDDESSTKHWSLTTNGFYLGMGVKHSFEPINNSFEVGLLNILALKYNSLHGQVITLGAGIHHRSYSIKRPNMLIRDDVTDAVVLGTYPTNNDAIKNRASNLNMWAMQFPLMFSQRIVKKLHFTVGGIMNWNYMANVSNHYELNKVEHDTRYKGLKQQKINFDFMGSLLWNDFGVYTRFSTGKFFKDGHGPEIKETWTVGLMIGL